MSVIHNTKRPYSVLKRKSNSICFHSCREAVTMDEISNGHFRSKNNPADLATKVLGGGAKRNGLISQLLHDLPEFFQRISSDTAQFLFFDTTHFKAPDFMFYMGIDKFPCQHALAKYGTKYCNMSCIFRQDCTLFHSSRTRGGYFNQHVGDADAGTLTTVPNFHLTTMNGSDAHHHIVLS